MRERESRESVVCVRHIAKRLLTAARKRVRRRTERHEEREERPQKRAAAHLATLPVLIASRSAMAAPFNVLGFGTVTLENIYGVVPGDYVTVIARVDPSISDEDASVSNAVWSQALESSIKSRQAGIDIVCPRSLVGVTDNDPTRSDEVQLAGRLCIDYGGHYGSVSSVALFLEHKPGTLFSGDAIPSSLELDQLTKAEVFVSYGTVGVLFVALDLLFFPAPEPSALLPALAAMRALALRRRRALPEE